MDATTNDERPDLTPAEAAARAGRSEHTILRWVRDSRLPAKRDPITRHIRIRVADLDRLLASEPAVVTATN